MSDSETSEPGRAVSPTADRELDHELMSALAEAATPADSDFDHRLTRSSVSMRLFGRGEVLNIGKYKVERRIGEGGMGEVYLCEDLALGRKVAIKRVLGSRSSGTHERLRREARALARLNHRNVVQVYDSGEHEGRTYVVMEYVEGQTLREWMRTRHDWREVLALFCDAGRGLAAAHAAGLVHRDFKPENVLIGADGIVRVADFGLVLADEPQPELADAATGVAEVPARLSAIGVAIGTRQYMPLEQILGGTVDARSDQFAFCMSLYEVMWGEPPFDYGDLQSRKDALLADTPKTPRTQRDLFFRVIRRGLARDPDARWPSMTALISALEGVPRKRRLTAAATVVGVGIVSSYTLTRAFAIIGVDPEAQEGVAHGSSPAELEADARAAADARADDAYLRGTEALNRGDLVTAVECGASMAAAQAEFLPARHPARGYPQKLLAIAAGMEGNCERAVEHAHSAINSFALGGYDDELLYMREVLVNQFVECKQYDEAEKELEQLPEHAALLFRTELALRRGQLDRADQYLSRFSGQPRDEHDEFLYQLLRALVDLRLGHSLPLAQVQALKTALVRTYIVAGQLLLRSPKLMTPEERLALGL